MKMRLENFRNWSSFWDICVYNKIFRLNWACERKKYIRILFFRESTCIWNCSTVHFFCQENSRSSWRIFAISPDFPSNWYSLWQCRRLVQIHLWSRSMIFGNRVSRASSTKKSPLTQYRGSPTYTKITNTVSTTTVFSLCTCKWGI